AAVVDAGAYLELVPRLDLAGQLADAAIAVHPVGGGEQVDRVACVDVADHRIADGLSTPRCRSQLDLPTGADMQQRVLHLLTQLLQGDAPSAVDHRGAAAGGGPVRVERDEQSLLGQGVVGGGDAVL